MKTILITGGSDGLGKALATDLAKDYAVVILADDAGQCSAVAAELDCSEVVADVSDYAQVEKAVEDLVAKHGGIDVLINCAGVWMEGPLEVADPARIEAVVRVNTLGTIFATRAALPHMKQKGSGRIVNIVSQDGLKPKVFHAAYCASKWAVTGFTKTLAEELRGSGVSVSGIYPGPMKTKLFEKGGVERDMSDYLDPAEVVRAIRFAIESPGNVAIPEIGVVPSPRS